MNIDELAEEMGIDIFCEGCRLMPIDCVCGFTEEDWQQYEAAKQNDPSKPHHIS